MTCTKTQDAQLMGEYKPTDLDCARTHCDFKILQVAPFVVQWAGGQVEIMTPDQLAKAKAGHTWMTDF